MFEAISQINNLTQEIEEIKVKELNFIFWRLYETILNDYNKHQSFQVNLFEYTTEYLNRMMLALSIY